MSAIYDIPEIGNARGAGGRIRIPPGVDVPLTDRVRRLIDSAGFRRLAEISQLGLVRLIYPGATHTRQEHSLGVFLAAIEYLDHLAADKRFTAVVSPKDAELLLAAALLHDVGHWPFGHPIEDIGLSEIPNHESLAAREITTGQIAETLHNDWHLDPAAVANLVCGKVDRAAHRLLHSILSGPIDVDKIDYLMRDSLHAGVPYGQNFDRRRLIGSLCLNESWRRPRDHRQRQNRRRNDGLRPLRNVQRSVLAPRRSVSHGDAAARVLHPSRSRRTFSIWSH